MSRLSRSNLAADPFRQFGEWLDDAVAAEVAEPTAMALATVGGPMQPAVRMVLLKGFDHRGFVFATNYESRKAQELERHGHAALLFYWNPLHRQVRIEGATLRLPAEESDAIFRARPLGARRSAWASPQSRPVDDRRSLDELAAAAAKRFPGEVPRPPFWGGYRLRPATLEFWQGHENRLHDRLRYTLTSDGRWQIERLAP